MLAIAAMFDSEPIVHAYALPANERLANTKLSTRAMAREALRTARIALTILRRAGGAKDEGRDVAEIYENTSIGEQIGPAAVASPCLDGRARHRAV